MKVYERRLWEAWAEYSRRPHAKASANVATDYYNQGLADATEAALCALLHPSVYGKEHSHDAGPLKLTERTQK